MLVNTIPIPISRSLLKHDEIPEWIDQVRPHLEELRDALINQGGVPCVENHAGLHPHTLDFTPDGALSAMHIHIGRQDIPDKLTTGQEIIMCDGKGRPFVERRMDPFTPNESIGKTLSAMCACIGPSLTSGRLTVVYGGEVKSTSTLKPGVLPLSKHEQETTGDNHIYDIQRENVTVTHLSMGLNFSDKQVIIDF